MGFIKRYLARRLAKSQHEKIEDAANRANDKVLCGDHRQQQHEFANARKSILGELSSKPISAVQTCSKSAKAKSRADRLDLLSRAIVACPQHAEQAARLRKDMDEVENMRCAKHVYLANENPVSELGKNPPPGFKEPTLDELKRIGIHPSDLTGKDPSGFRAKIYVKDPEVWGKDPKPAYVLSFRGSTNNAADWENNFAQGLNEDSPYYEQAVNIGKKLRDSDADVQIVGHSLGGGLASAAQGASGLPTSTYNASGLEDETVQRYLKKLGHDGTPVGDPDSINAFRISGEVLTKKQESGLLGRILKDAAGKNKVDLPPPLSEDAFNRLKKDGKVDAEEDYPTYLHGMEKVIDAMEMRKQADQAALEKCVGKTA